MSTETYDTLIIGAGLSGIGAACHFQQQFPNKRYAVLERREAMGGTWDLFKYPGIRSDSDMYTLGFEFRPWTDTRLLADGPSIKSYIQDTAAEFAVDKHIHYGLKITHASWSSEKALWSLTAERESTGETETWRCNFLILCTGYYNYDEGYTPELPGAEQFGGQIIHPQKWPENLDYKDKRVVVIGSGATAVTLVPAMAGEASHVTMLQRSPSYIFTLPAIDQLSKILQKFLPESWVYKMARRRNIRLQRWFYVASIKWPKLMRKFFLSGIRKQMPADYDMRHFEPSYNPWDQRVCAVPDGDLFESIKSGKASVATDHIDSFNESGVRLKSGAQIDADIVVTATGLNLRLMGGMTVDVDGETRNPRDVLTYKATLIQDAPNVAVIFGYTNAPWTLKADIAARYACRLIKHMDKKGYRSATPRDTTDSALPEVSALDSLKSGYVARAANELPRQGKELPWAVLNHYRRDQKMLLKEPIEDEYLEFA